MALCIIKPLNDVRLNLSSLQTTIMCLQSGLGVARLHKETKSTETPGVIS